MRPGSPAMAMPKENSPLPKKLTIEASSPQNNKALKDQAKHLPGLRNSLDNSGPNPKTDKQRLEALEQACQVLLEAVEQLIAP